LHGELIKFIAVNEALIEKMEAEGERDYQMDMQKLKNRHDRTKLWIKVLGTAITVVGGAVTTFLTVYFSS
jgi:hypothetical protein